MEGLERAAFKVGMSTVQQAAVTILAPIISVASPRLRAVGTKAQVC